MAFDFSAKKPGIIIAITALVTALAVYSASSVSINADFSGLLPKDEALEELAAKYGVDDKETALVLLAAEGEGLFTIPALKAFEEAVEVVASSPGMASVPVSPFTLIRFSNDGFFELMSPSGRAPETEEELSAFKARLEATPYAKNLVVSRDLSLLAAYFEVERSNDYASVMERVAQAEDILRAAGLEPRMSGTAPFVQRTSFYISRDLGVLLAVAALIILCFYYVGFRSKRAVLMPFAVVAVGTAWTIGFMGIMGYSLTLVSIVIPPLILTLGSEYSIHLLNEYFRLGDEPASGGLAAQAAFNVRKTIVLASLTTVVGFLSLLVTSMRETREFAVTAAFSFVACAALSLFFLPAALSFMRKPGRDNARQILFDPVSRLAKGMGSLVSGAWKWILAVGIAIAVVFAFSLRLLTFNTDVISYFPGSDPLIKDMYALAGKLGGSDEINVSLVAPEGERGFFREREALEASLGLVDALLENPDLSFHISLPSLARELSRVKGGQPLEASARQLATMLRGLEGSGGLGVMGNLVDRDFTRVTLAFRMYDSSTGRYMDEARFRSLVGFIEKTIAASDLKGAKATLWGESMRILKLASMLRDFLFQSMAVSILAILVITSIAFASVLYGLLSLIPLLLGLMANFILMVNLGIPLDMTTIMVSSIAIGVGIDNSIHFLLRYRRQRTELGQGAIEAVKSSLELTGRPILLTSASIALGLLAFLLSSFKPIIYFGLLVIFSLTATAAGTLIALPSALLAKDGFRRKGPRP
jgi:hypothetical protein